jgi:hypothetical protein
MGNYLYRLRKPLAVSSLACLLLDLTLLVAGCETRSAPGKSFMVQPEQLLGGWQGLSDDGVFYIMGLHSNGSGTFAYTSRDAKPVVFEVTNWQCSHKRFLLVVEAKDENPDAVQKVEGIPGWLSMDLVVSGQAWQRKVAFYREQEWERLRSLLKTSMVGHESEDTGAKQTDPKRNSK